MKRSSSSRAAGPLVQPALEPVAEQRAERLAAAHAVEQRQRVADAGARQVDVQRLVVRVAAAVGEPAAAQHAGRGGVDQSRRVDVAAVHAVVQHVDAVDLTRRRGGAQLDVLEPRRRRRCSTPVAAAGAQVAAAAGTAAEVIQASRRCEQQSSVSREQQPPLVHRLDVRDRLERRAELRRPPRSRGTARRRAASRSPSRSSSVRGSGPGDLLDRRSARPARGTGWRAATDAEVEPADLLVDVLGGLGDDGVVERLALQRPRSSAARTSSRSTSTRALADGFAQRPDAARRGTSRSRLSASTSRACASSTCSTLLCARPGGARLRAGSPRTRWSVSCTSGSASERVFLPTSRSSSSASGSTPASSRITLGDLLLRRAGRRGPAG